MTARAEDIKTALRFYEALGFSRLPIELPKASTADKGNALRLLREEMGDCALCKLSSGRKNIVFGEGSPEARIMFIGEGPGREEDIEGRPFVGEAGGLLSRLIKKMGLDREEVYIGNIIKCRPPGNRDPEDDETAACLPFIRRQIEIISPEVIISLGRISSQALLETKAPISRLRGKFADYCGTPVMPTFHPAYLLRNKNDMPLVCGDALKVLKLLAGPQAGETASGYCGGCLKSCKDHGADAQRTQGK